MKSHRRKARARETSAPKPEIGTHFPPERSLSALANGSRRQSCGEASEVVGSAPLQIPGPAGGRGRVRESPFDESNVSGAGPLGRFLDGELHPLSFPKQLEHRAPYSAAVE